MTDISNAGKTGTGWVKVSIGALYFDACQHLTPFFCGLLRVRYPAIIDDALAFELVVFVEATIGGAMAKWTPDYMVDSIVSAIRWFKAARQKIADA